jgi:hypothetical protein
MLVRPQCGGLKVAGALAAIGLLLAACEPGTNPLASATPSKSPVVNPAATLAGDLRTHLNLLLGEQVMIVAKETIAAANHTDDYAAYTTLLATNASDLADAFRRAFGNTTAARLSDTWNTQNTYLVDYAIGVVTHNNAKAKTAMSNLTQKFVPQFAQLVSDASHLPLDPVTQLLSQQVLEDKLFIDDYFAVKYTAFYADLHRAYVQASRLGDALSVEIAHRFPDKFPGDPELRAVSVRTSANQNLQEHAYLSTMATAASIAGRTAETGAAASALAESSSGVAGVFASTLGILPSDLVEQLGIEQNALFAYAAGEATAKPMLTQKFVDAFASAAHVTKADVANHVNATMKVIDDQRAKNWTAVASDDRAAATSIQPIGDSIQG